MRTLKDRLQFQSKKYLNADVTNNDINNPYQDYVEFKTNRFKNNRYAPFNQVDIQITGRCGLLPRTYDEIINQVIMKFQIVITNLTTHKIETEIHWVEKTNLTDTLTPILNAQDKCHQFIDVWAKQKVGH